MSNFLIICKRLEVFFDFFEDFISSGAKSGGLFEALNTCKICNVTDMHKTVHNSQATNDIRGNVIVGVLVSKNLSYL